MGRTANNTTMCAYLRRKDNSLGDDIEKDFEEPIYFLARKENITKRTASIGGMIATSVSSYFVTYDLPLSSKEMKKDDVIFMNARNIKYMADTKMWRVVSTEIVLDSLHIIPDDEEEAEQKALKRIEVM